MKALFTIIVMLLFSFPAFSVQKFKYNELQIKDYDEMLDKVNAYVAESRQLAIKYQEEGDDETGDQMAIDKLSEGLTYILSRPDKDNMLAKLLPTVRKELINYSAFETSLSLAVTDAITAIQSTKLPATYRATSVFVLENVMAQVQPLISTNKDMRAIVEKIRDAKLEIPSDVMNDRKLKSMFNTSSPSKTAEKVLAKYPFQPLESETGGETKE